MANIQEFIREYIRAVSQGYAAVFAGAGLSRGSGYINWKEFVRPLAEDIGLNVDKEEHDLVSIMQYYRNEHGTRASINQKILNEFTKDTINNENLNILTRLPIDTYWTTNYDELIEEALKNHNRKVDIKITQKSLANNLHDRDAVVYKMHGDVKTPETAVLTKDDYEIYGTERPLFRTALQGELISKTFLFIGFSFEDPNLEYVLSQIRVLLGGTTRDHYCFFEKRKKKDNEKDCDYQYNVAKQNLRIKDLQRYGIQAIMLDSYSEITGILREIERDYLLKNIFISGSFQKNELSWENEKVISFSHCLAKQLVYFNYCIISGFGLLIGSTIINGALEEIMDSKYKHVEEHLYLRPFPQIRTGSKSLDQVWQSYREDMIDQAGIAIFIFGYKESKNGEIVIADGMLKEFEIAKNAGKVIIPVGSTGGSAAEIYKTVRQNIGDYPYLVNSIDDLGTETDVNKLIGLIIGIINKQQII